MPPAFVDKKLLTVRASLSQDTSCENVMPCLFNICSLVDMKNIGFPVFHTIFIVITHVKRKYNWII